MAKTHLQNAQNAKNDEFYTQYADIQKEVNAYLEFDPDAFRGKSVLLPCDDPEWSNFTIYTDTKPEGAAAAFAPTDQSAGRNACAIDVSSVPAKFWYWKRNGWGGYTWECKTEGVDW